MSALSTRIAESIAAETVAERPVPASFEDLDDRHRVLIEREAARARMTPSAFWILSRSRAGMSQGEKFKAHLADEHNLREGRAMNDPGTPSSVEHDLDAVVRSAKR